MAYTIVDDAQRIQPTTTKDMYWGGSTFDLPYTAASEQFRIIQPFKGSAVNLTWDSSILEAKFQMNLNYAKNVSIRWFKCEIVRLEYKIMFI